MPYEGLYGSNDTYALLSRMVDLEEFLMAPDAERRTAAFRRAPALQAAYEHWQP